MTQNLNLSMFRAYDIRTPASDLTPALAERLSLAEARYFRETLGVRRVILAHDARSSGPAYLDIASQVYRRAGLDVLYLPGVTSTSHFYFTAMRHPDAAGVMCGASHNPAGDTGRKIVAPGVRPIAEHIGPEGGLDRIKALYLEDAPAPGAAKAGRIALVDNLADYVSYSMNLAGVGVESLAGTSVLHDYVFGAGGREMMAAFGRAGAALSPLHFAPDGRFPLGDPNPVKPDVVRAGLADLASGDYLLGTFFDGDADRIDFYGSGARYLSSSFVYAAILPRILARRGGDSRGVFADLKCNPLALIEMARAGARVGVMRNGHSQIKNALAEDPGYLGAVEESAHFYETFEVDGARYSTENTLYIALLVTKTWADEPGRFERLFDIQAQTCREREWGHYFPDEKARESALDAVRAYFEADGAAARTSTRSGMDLEATLLRRGLPFEIDASTELPDGWLQVCQRISQSENGLARWEVVAGDAQTSSEAKASIQRIAAEHGASAPYQG